MARIGLEERVEDPGRGLSVEAPRGLVREDETGFVGVGPGDRNTLLLAARKLMGEVAMAVG